MNEVWLKITDDWTTLPPLEVPVFAAGGNLDAPCILVRCSDYDENGDPAWVWANPFGWFYFNKETGKWAVWDSEWDDDYQPEYWHAFPAEPPKVMK